MFIHLFFNALTTKGTGCSFVDVFNQGKLLASFIKIYKDNAIKYGYLYINSYKIIKKNAGIERIDDR